MKQNTLVSLLLGVSILFLVDACKSAYRTTATTAVTVEIAMKAWNSYVGSGKTTVDQELQVKAAYEKYQVAMNLVIDSALAYNKAKKENDPNLSNFQNSLNSAVVVSSAALSDIINLITSFGVKL